MSAPVGTRTGSAPLPRREECEPDHASRPFGTMRLDGASCGAHLECRIVAPAHQSTTEKSFDTVTFESATLVDEKGAAIFLPVGLPRVARYGRLRRRVRHATRPNARRSCTRYYPAELTRRLIIDRADRGERQAGDPAGQILVG